MQGRQHENSNGADQHIEFLDRKARTECSAGAEDISISYLADWKTYPLQDLDSLYSVFIS